MRVETTMSEREREQLRTLAEELDMNPSRVVLEALALLKTAVIEAKKGHRLAVIDGETERPLCVFTSPGLSQLEWAAYRHRLVLRPEAIARLGELVENPPEPAAGLRRAMKKRKA